MKHALRWTLGSRWPTVPVLNLSVLQWSVLISLCVHGLLLSLQLGSPTRPQRLIEDSPLEIVLVNARSRSRDTNPKPQALAQTTLVGGGAGQASARARSPLPNAPVHQIGQHLDAMEQQVTALQTQQSQLLAQVKAQLAQLPNTQLEKQSETTQARRRQLMRLLAEIEQRIETENARPRKRYLSPSTREVAYAQYYDRLRRKIETLGTQQFPQVGTRKLYGDLTMIVTVDSQGRVIGTEVVTSSGQPELDRRAQAIASRAGPFGAFTVDMKRQTDLLALVSRFSFTRDHRLQTELTGP
jgi:protein TonB